MEQHTHSVPNWHLQLFQIVTVDHADITAVSTHITSHNYLQALQKMPVLLQ